MIGGCYGPCQVLLGEAVKKSTYYRKHVKSVKVLLATMVVFEGKALHMTGNVQKVLDCEGQLCLAGEIYPLSGFSSANNQCNVTFLMVSSALCQSLPDGAKYCTSKSPLPMI